IWGMSVYISGDISWCCQENAYEYVRIGGLVGRNQGWQGRHLDEKRCAQGLSLWLCQPLRGQAGDQSGRTDRRGACRLLHDGAVAHSRRSLTTAACSGLRPAPDDRPRRALLHLSYSCAPLQSDGARDTRPKDGVIGRPACRSLEILGAALQADGGTRSAFAASSIRRRSAAWTILPD